MAQGQVMITGGDGYLGRQVARRYLEQTEAMIVLWVHATSQEQFTVKQQQVVGELGASGTRVRFCYGDLVQEHPFQDVAPTEVHTIIHAAAVTRFNVDEETARKVNIEGTEKLLDFAGGCPALRAFGLLSTVYASGLKAGRIDEVAFDGREGFTNHYERSKWAAETALLTRFDHLPWRIFRIATAIADDESGAVSQQNAFHNTLKLFFYGLLSLIPGKPQTPLYFVTGRFAADAVFELMQQAANHQIYHVAHTKEESLSLGALIDLAFETFMQEEDFKLRRILKPLWTDAEAFDLLAEGVHSFGGGVVNQAVSSVAPFARQLFVDKEIRNDHLASELKAYRAPDARRLMQNTCEYLVRMRWGRPTQHAA